MCKKPKIRQVKCSIDGCEFMEYTSEKETLCAMHYEEMMRAESGLLSKPMELRSTTLDRPEIIERMFFAEEGKPMGLTTAEKIQKDKFLGALSSKKRIPKGKFKRTGNLEVGQIVQDCKILEVFELEKGETKRRIKAVCHCGFVFVALQQNLKTGHTKSCGCLSGREKK